MKLNIKKINYYGLDHDMVNKKFEGELTFINYFPIKHPNGSYYTAAVYKAKNPDKKKGHKKYMTLAKSSSGQWFVNGKTLKQLNESRFVNAVLCKICNTALYSVHRHDFHSCDCKNETFIDGGLDYTRIGAVKVANTKTVIIDLLKDKVILNGKK